MRCSPGRSSPRYQMLVMNPVFFMPCILVTKIVDRVDFRVFFFRNFQVFDNTLTQKNIMHEDPENPGVNLSDFINILNTCFKCVEEMKFCTKKKPHK